MGSRRVSKSVAYNQGVSTEALSVDRLREAVMSRSKWCGRVSGVPLVRVPRPVLCLMGDLVHGGDGVPPMLVLCGVERSEVYEGRNTSLAGGV